MARKKTPTALDDRRPELLATRSIESPELSGILANPGRLG